MAIAPDKPTLSATPNSYSILLTYGVTSFGDPSTGTLSLYSANLSPYVLDTQTSVGEYQYWISSGGYSWANTESTYRAVADNGTLTNQSDDVTVVTLPPNFSISGNTIVASNIMKNSFDVTWHPVALGHKYQVDLYASLDEGATWILVAQNIQNATDYTHTFSGLTPGTTYRVLTQSRDSIGRTADVVNRIPIVTTLGDPKLYGSVNGQTKKVAKLYGSVNGQTKLITKLYGSANGTTKLIYEG